MRYIAHFFMAKSLHKFITEHRSEYILNHKKDYGTPQIYHGGPNYDLKKRWYVYYTFRNPETGKMVTQTPIYYNVNRSFKTKRERLKFLNVLRDEVEELLKSGYSPYVKEGSEQMSTAEAMLDFALEIKKNSVSNRSYKDYESRTKIFKKFLERNRLLRAPIDEITKKVVMDYLNEILQTSSPRNRNNARTVLSTIFGVLEDNEYIPRNFVANIKKLKTDPERNKTYTTEKTEEIFQYLEKNNPNLYLYIKFVSFNFLRPVEVCRLKVGDIDLEGKRLYVRAKNKSLKLKIIPDILIPELQHLKSLPDDYYLFTPEGPGPSETEEINRRDYFTKQYKEVKTVLNLSKDYTIYSFRHTFITKLYTELRNKYTLSECQDKLMLITGHSTLTALKNYLRDIDAELPEDYSGML